MTPDAWMDLIYEAHAAVVEQAFLFEVPLGSSERKDDHEVRLGPWDTEACSTVLTIWFELDWIGIYMPSEQLERWADRPATWMPRLAPGHHPLLAKADARHLLATPSLWTADRADGWTALQTTDTAPVTDLNVWFRDIPVPLG